VCQVAKNISASLHYLQLFALHRNISFRLFKRSRVVITDYTFEF